MDNSSWLLSRAIATLILRDRDKRRDFMTKLLLVLLALFAVGVWPLDSWLTRGLWRFVLYWGGTAFLSIFLILLTAYDVLAVIKEERGQFHDENGRISEAELQRLVAEAKADLEKDPPVTAPDRKSDS